MSDFAKDINAPNTDTISRQGAIDGLSGHYVERRNLNDWQIGWNNALEWVEDVYLKDLPSVQPKPHYDKWCNDCKEYDKERHCCPRWNRVIRQTLKDAQPEQRWIPCSERLPEQYGNYLISYRTDDFESDIGTFDPDRINLDTGEWSACDANGFYWVASKGLEVIAWMPLPESYSGE